VVVNRHPNLPREAFDQMKATLHRLRLQGRALEAGPRAELLGRIAWARQLNPARGDKLLTWFRQIGAEAAEDQSAMRNS